jgi:transcriptional regulator with XRE-family HTH domain
MSGYELARRSFMSQAKISRIETGGILPSVLDVERLAKALDLEEKLTQEVLGLAREANIQYRTWRSYKRLGLKHKQKELAALEKSSSTLRYFLPARITGLLQTPEYMLQALNSPVTVSGPSFNYDEIVSYRIRRQEILQDINKKFTFLFTESALRWQICSPTTMAIQYQKLLHISTLSNVSIQLIPLSTIVTDGPMNGFVIYDDRIVTVETFGGETVLRDPRDVEYHSDLVSFFEESSLSQEGTRELLQKFFSEAIAVP